MASDKKYIVVGFVCEDKLSVVPFNWLTSGDYVLWPSSCTKLTIEKMIKMRFEPADDWEKFKVKIYFRTNSFLNAITKCTKLQLALNVDSEQDYVGPRKRKLPKRFLETDYTVKKSSISQTVSQPSTSRGEESLSEDDLMTHSKLHPIPDLPELSKSIKEKSSLLSSNLPGNEFSFSMTSESTPTHNRFDAANLEKETKYIEKSKFDYFVSQSLKLHNRTLLKLEEVLETVNDLRRDLLENQDERLLPHSLDFLPEGIQLPIESEEDFLKLNDMLRESNELQNKLARYLQVVCLGKNPSIFFTSVFKKIIVQEIALQYSRIGRKGKKSLMALSDMYNTIVAAGIFKFPSLSAEEAGEKIGRALATSLEWRGKIKNDIEIKCE